MRLRARAGQTQGGAPIAPPALGRVVGDHLVRPHSASGRGKTRRIPFEPEHGLTLTGLHHFDLLNHPHIYCKLRQWVTDHRHIAAAHA